MTLLPLIGGYIKKRKDDDELLLYFMPTSAGSCRFSQYYVFLKRLIEKQKLQYYKEEINDKIQLEVKQDVYEVEQQFKGLNLAQERKDEAIEVYRIVEKRYRIGEA